MTTRRGRSGDPAFRDGTPPRKRYWTSTNPKLRLVVVRRSRRWRGGRCRAGVAAGRGSGRGRGRGRGSQGAARKRDSGGSSDDGEDDGEGDGSTRRRKIQTTPV